MLFQLSVLFSLLMVILALSMLIHTYQSRRKIFNNFQRISSEIEGKAYQKNFLAFPSFEGKDRNRGISSFFHIAEGKQTSVIYFTSSIEARSPFTLFLKKENFFKPVQNSRLENAIGKIIPDLDSRFEARSNDAERARKFFQNEKVINKLSELGQYSTIMCGPDAIIISKPYDGVKETNAAAVVKGVKLLHNLAEAIESIP